MFQNQLRKIDVNFTSLNYGAQALQGACKAGIFITLLLPSHMLKKLNSPITRKPDKVQRLTRVHTL
jgi:hypothetical protein